MQNMPPPSLVDVLALSAVSLITLRGYLRGLSGELAQLVSAVAALALGVLFFGPVAAWCVAHTRLAPASARAAAFVVVIAAAVAALVLVRLALKRIMKVAFEERFDRAGGLVAGFVRACALVTLVLMVMNLWPHAYLNRKFGEESVLGTVLLRRMPFLREQAAPPRGPAGPER